MVTRAGGGVWAGAAFNTSIIEVLTVDMSVDVLIIMSNVAVGLMMNDFVDVILGVLANIEIDVLVDGNVNVFVGAMTVFDFVMPDPLE